MSRIEEDVLYRVYGEAYSSITLAGVLYSFNQYGHSFLILDARTGLHDDFVEIISEIQLNISS